MYKFFKTKTIKRKMMKFCLSIPGDRSVSNFNKSASGESQNIMAEYVIESWKCQLENFWRVSNMDYQLYFWQLKDIWVLIPKAELDREGEHQRDDSPSWVPVDWRIFLKKCWYWLKPSGILSWMFTIHNILNSPLWNPNVLIN